MPVSSFSNKSFAYKRGDKEKRIVSRVGPYPVNKPSTTTSNGVAYTRSISSMYAFGHSGGSLATSPNHGWWNAVGSETAVAHFAQLFNEATFLSLVSFLLYQHL